MAIVIAVAALVWFVILPSAPCAAPGGDSCSPGDDAIGLVPADAVTYVHLNVDSGTDQFSAASDVASRLPLLTQLAVAQVASVAGERINFDTDIRPWSGGEAALAILPGTGNLGRVLMLESDDDNGAREFASGLLGPTASSSDFAGTKLSVGADNLSSAIYDNFLLIGDIGALRQILDPPAGSETLADAAPSAIQRLPADSLALRVRLARWRPQPPR